MFEELANDEKVHSAQLKEALNLLQLNNPAKEAEGAQEAKEMIENKKIDSLIESVEKLVSVISESKEEKADKQEDNEKKETKEKKEAKEAKEAAEAKEAPIVEDKKEDKEDKNKPEDEKKDDEESAVADSVTEAKKELTHDEKVQQIIDPHKGLTKEQIEKGYVQTNFIPKEDAEKMVSAEEKATAEKKAMMDKLQSGAKKVRKRAEVAKQLSLGLDKIDEGNNLLKTVEKYPNKALWDKNPELARKMLKTKEYEKMLKKASEVPDSNIKEEQEMPVQAVGDSAKSAQEAKPEIKEPISMDREDIKRALKAKVNNQKVTEV